MPGAAPEGLESENIGDIRTEASAEGLESEDVADISGSQTKFEDLSDDATAAASASWVTHSVDAAYRERLI